MHLTNLDEVIDLDEIIENDIWALFNPKAGSHARRIEKDARESLGTDHVNYYVSSSKEDLTRMVSWLAAEAEKKQSAIMVLIFAGDGGYNDAINASGDLKRLIFGFTAGGSSSDFARTLNMKKSHKTCKLINALRYKKIALEERVKPIDLIRISYTADNQEKVVKALNLFSMGFDGEVCKLVNSSAKNGGARKKTGFIPASLKVLKYYVPLEINYAINNDPERNDIAAKNVLTFTIINGRYAASGMNYNPYFEVSDGFVEAIIAKHRSKLSLINRIVHLKFLQDNQHIDSLPGKDGYNRLGIRYEDKINSIALQVTNAAGKNEDYFETDGEHHKYDIQQPVRLQVLHHATNALYIPYTS
jgi:diacylglycerol kinase family enzyme